MKGSTFLKFHSSPFSTPTRKAFCARPVRSSRPWGRAARHLEGKAILYADRITDSMKQAMGETERRRVIQRQYNEDHGITPQSIINKMDMGLAQILKAEYGDVMEEEAAGLPDFTSQEEVEQYIAKLESDMREAAKRFEFEKAAKLRDSIKELRDKEFLFG